MKHLLTDIVGSYLKGAVGQFFQPLDSAETYLLSVALLFEHDDIPYRFKCASDGESIDVSRGSSESCSADNYGEVILRDLFENDPWKSARAYPMSCACMVRVAEATVGAQLQFGGYAIFIYNVGDDLTVTTRPIEFEGA